MLTADHVDVGLEVPEITQSQKKTILSDLEILQRVRSIRSQWTIAERINRRQTAQQRFSDLLVALDLDCEAA